MEAGRLLLKRHIIEFSLGVTELSRGAAKLCAYR